MIRRTVNGPGGMKIKIWICRDKRNGSGCRGQTVKEEKLLKYSVKNDMRTFVERITQEDVDLKQLGIRGKTKESILEQLMGIYR